MYWIYGFLAALGMAAAFLLVAEDGSAVIAAFNGGFSILNLVLFIEGAIKSNRSEG